jgi:ABC-type Mn2+/Zn2+ transport system permease subunit
MTLSPTLAAALLGTAAATVGCNLAWRRWVA